MEMKDMFTDLLLLVLTILGVMTAKRYQNMHYSEKMDDYYTEIENLIQSGYTVYVNSSAVDSNKVVINDYLADNIYVNKLK